MANVKEVSDNTNESLHTILDKCKLLDTDIHNYIESQFITEDENTLKNDILKFKNLAHKKIHSYRFNNAFLSYLHASKDKGNDLLIKQVSEAIECRNVFLQNGYEYQTHTCKRKTCLACQNKRTAQLIDGYLSQLDFSKGDIYFGTATKSATSKKMLQQNVNDTVHAFSVIVRNMKKTYGLNVQAIRSLESTHNIDRDTYHVHVHYLIKGKEQAELFQKLWFDHWTRKNGYTIDPRAQHLTIADMNSGLELFKYCTKLEDKVSFEALSNILYVFQNRRLIQAYGLKKQMANEDEKTMTKNVSNGYKIEIYKYDDNELNYTSATDKMTRFVPNKKQLEIYNKLKKRQAQYETAYKHIFVSNDT